MVVLRQIFGTSTTHIPTHEVYEVLREYLCSGKYAGVKSQIFVLTLAYSTIHRYAYNTSETSCVSTLNVSGVSSKYLY